MSVYMRTPLRRALYVQPDAVPLPHYIGYRLSSVLHKDQFDTKHVAFSTRNLGLDTLC